MKLKIEKINGTKNSCFVIINKIDKTLAKHTKEKVGG